METEAPNPSVEATRNSGPRYTGLSSSVPRGPLLRAPHLQRWALRHATLPSAC